ncbi:KSR2 Kinase, partial [Tyrannus savana]|nr:KSR2 Kinase [Tyrannus savana]
TRGHPGDPRGFFLLFQSKLVKYFSRQLSCKRKVALQERNAKLEGFPQLLHWFRIVDIRKEVMEEIAPGQLSLEELLDMTDDQVCATVEKFGANSEECARLNASLSCLRSVHKSGGSLSKQDWTIQWPTTEPGKENSPGCQAEPGQWARTHLSQSPKVQPKCGQHHCHGGSPHAPLYTHVDRLTVEAHPGLCPPLESGHRSLPPSPRQRHAAHTPPRTPNIVTTMTPPGTPPVRRRNKLKPPGTPPPSSRKLIHLIPGFTALHRSKSHEFQLGHRVDEAHTPKDGIYFAPSFWERGVDEEHPEGHQGCWLAKPWNARAWDGWAGRGGGLRPQLRDGRTSRAVARQDGKGHLPAEVWIYEHGNPDGDDSLYPGHLLACFPSLACPEEALRSLPTFPLLLLCGSGAGRGCCCAGKGFPGANTLALHLFPPLLMSMFRNSFCCPRGRGAKGEQWPPWGIICSPRGRSGCSLLPSQSRSPRTNCPVVPKFGVLEDEKAVPESRAGLWWQPGYPGTAAQTLLPIRGAPAGTREESDPSVGQWALIHVTFLISPPFSTPPPRFQNEEGPEEAQESEDDFEEMNLSLLSARNFPRKASQTSIFLQEWDIPFEQLEIGELIGKGRFGQVFHGRWHGEVAIRLIDIERDNEDQLKAFKREVMAYRQTRHENVVLFMGACMSPPHLAIITSLCKGRTLYSVVRDAKIVLDVNKTRQIAQEIVKGMGYLHAKGILHKDLKSKNVFYDNGKVVITDFGLFSISGVLQAGRRENKLRIQNGWLCHLAPEIIRQLSPDTEEDKLPFSKHSDVFALGTIWYELHAREWPFKTQPAEAIIWQVGRGMKPNLSQIGMGKEISDILLFCWAYEQEERPTFTKLMDMLEKLPKRNRRLSHPGHFWKSAE